MFPRFAALALGLTGALALTACSAHSAARPGLPASVSDVPRGRMSEPPGAVILTASASGAVVADPATRSYRGYTTAGDLVWTDRDAYRADAEVICAARCPDAVVSPAGGEPAWMWTGSRRVRPAVPTSARRVLAVRGRSDAVTVEDEGGNARIRVDRADGTRTHVGVAGAAGVLWTESSARSAALAVYGTPGRTGTGVLAFRRDGRGWRPSGPPVPAAGAWGACLAPDGRAVLAGPRGHLLANGHMLPLASDLPQVGECAAGRSGAVLAARWVDPGGTPHTDLRGVDAAGRRTWARDVPAQVDVAAHPSGRRFALTAQAVLEIVDLSGRTLARLAGVSSARYTEDGRLITLGQTGVPRWTNADLS
ncbi:hypothetical protein [Spongiactinospora sp. 9N601]|uniref:hypothetical protein n=1 Tax=Spongiactinospora sp. 9N601 TaxID=3375149 RepID=UPI00379D4261